MALTRQFEKFPNEESFRDKFLVPMLHRLGYSVVINNHGNREFGRHIIFGEIDGFAHFCFYGLQAKFEESIGLGKKIDDLLTDVSQAFNTPFTHSHTGDQQRISRFYVVNGGSISDQGKEAFFNGIHNPTERANTRLLDGKGLIALDRLAAYKRGEYVKEQLAGMLTEIRYNSNILSDLQKDMCTFVDSPEGMGTFPIQRCRLQATSAILERPIPVNTEFFDNIQVYWQVIRATNDIADSIGVPISTAGYKRGRSESLVKYAQQMITLGLVIERQITEQ